MDRLGWALAVALCGCGLDSVADGPDEGSDPAADGESGDGDEGDDAAVPSRLTHAFGAAAMSPQTDDNTQCVSWTLDNEQALYVNNVVLANEGGFHHSNWFVVPEDVYEGPDGYWPCTERGYEEVESTKHGTVLFAQSTQSYVETQKLAEGAVIKIPPRSRIVAGVHTLNPAPREASSRLWLTLEVVHPSEVKSVVSPMSLMYGDLRLPPLSQSRFTADCNLATPHEAVTGEELALRVHYILPHYHYLGNYFDVTVVGGEHDGESIYRLDGFNADANGKTFDPPLDLPGAKGLKMTCGYDNWRSETVEWGDADGEMCVMLGLVEAQAVLGGTVAVGTPAPDQDGITSFGGTCFSIAVEKSEQQTMPTEDEIAAPLYLPPVEPGDADIPPVPTCRDADPEAAPEEPVTLESLRQTVFEPACTFSSCHGQSGAGGLDLTIADVRSALLDHEVIAEAGMPLVTPGDPDRSWLYHLVSRCEPETAGGGVAAHMPLNAPILLEDALVAKLRAWIERGAPDD